MKLRSAAELRQIVRLFVLVLGKAGYGGAQGYLRDPEVAPAVAAIPTLIEMLHDIERDQATRVLAGKP